MIVPFREGERERRIKTRSEYLRLLLRTPAHIAEAAILRDLAPSPHRQPEDFAEHDVERELREELDGRIVRVILEGLTSELQARVNAFRRLGHYYPFCETVRPSTYPIDEPPDLSRNFLLLHWSFNQEPDTRSFSVVCQVCQTRFLLAGVTEAGRLVCCCKKIYQCVLPDD